MATKCIDKDIDNNDIIVINTSDSDINTWANEYIQNYDINPRTSIGFNSMILYISNHLNINTNDLDALVYYFNIYATLCSQCHILPDMTSYSFLVGVPYETMREWMSGQNRSATHTPLVKKMQNFCKMTCVSEAGRGNVGAIYVSKAIHGLSDQAPPAQLTQNNLYINAPISREKIAQEFGRCLEIDCTDLQQP